MSNKDDFELDAEDVTEEEFDDVSLEEEGPVEEAPKKKKSGGGLMIFVVLLAVLGGGGFAAVKFLGVQLPFDVPGLTQTAQVPADQQQPAADTTMTASADLSPGDLPPQPAVPADEAFADAVNTPFGIPEETTPDDGAVVNAPWGGEDQSPAAAAEALKQQSVDAFNIGDTQVAAQPDTTNIVDPFAFGTQDVTAVVNAPETAAPAADVVDPFAVAPISAPAATEAPPATAVAVTPPSEDKAAQARVAELEKKLAATEKSLSDSEKALKKANEALSAKNEELARVQSDLTAAQAAAKSAASAKPTAVKTESAPKVDSAPKAAAKPAAAPARKIEWVLRSAKPGMAWVSEKGSSEMRTVSVGDSLAGIGKVTAIATDSQGRWVVNGTRGTINQ